MPFLMCTIFRMLPMLIGYFLIKRFNVQIKFGRVSFPFSLRAVKIIKNGFSIVSIVYTVYRILYSIVIVAEWIAYIFVRQLNCDFFRDLQQIDEISIRSSFLNSEVSKLLSITIRDIRINKDINGTSAADQTAENARIDVATKIYETPDLDVIDFRQKKVPPFVVKFAQFMSVHVQNISVVVMNNNYNPSWFMHATAGVLVIDGTTLHSAKTLIVTAALNEAHVSNCFDLTTTSHLCNFTNRFRFRWNSFVTTSR